MLPPPQTTQNEFASRFGQFLPHFWTFWTLWAVFRGFQILQLRNNPTDLSATQVTLKSLQKKPTHEIWCGCLPAKKVYATFGRKRVVFGDFSLFSTPHNSKTAQPIYQQLKFR